MGVLDSTVLERPELGILGKLRHDSLPPAVVGSEKWVFCCFRGWSPTGKGRAATASGEHGHGDERFGGVEPVGPLGECP